MAEEQLGYVDVLGRIAELAEELTELPDRSAATKVGELLDWVDAFHRDGLGRLVDMIREWRGEIFLESVARDELAGTLLAAYDLGEERGVLEEATDAVTAALEDVRPMVESHGGAIDLDSVVDGVVKVRLRGTCDGCPSSSATLTYGVEAALVEHWPGFRRLEVVEAAAAADPAKAGLTCGIPAPEAPPRPEPVAQPVLLRTKGRPA